MLVFLIVQGFRQSTDSLCSGLLTSISFAVLVRCGPAEQRLKVVLDVESVGLGVSYSSAFLDHAVFG